MAKKRRKLSKEFEKLMSISNKDIELITAKIHDIYDDDIRTEYAIAFAPIKNTLSKIKAIYTEIGFTDESDYMYQYYLDALQKFKEEYEI